MSLTHHCHLVQFDIIEVDNKLHASTSFPTSSFQFLLCIQMSLVQQFFHANGNGSYLFWTNEGHGSKG